jgi:hypothetical protein
VTILKANYTKWLRRDLWTLQQALFLLLGVEPPDDYFNPDGSAYSYYESYESRYSKVAKSYKEYLELADDAISLRTLTPFSIHEYTAPIHEMKFDPKHILE